jgi:hypothetical protein
MNSVESAGEPVVAAYTPITSLLHAGRHRRRDAELPYMPEPEFFFLLFVACAILGVCGPIAGGLYFWGRRKKSRLLKVLAVLPLIPGLVVFVPMFLLLVMWVWYWVFGDKTAAGTAQGSPPAITNYMR